MMYGALCVCICLATLLITATLGAAVSAALAPLLLRFTRSWDPTPRAGALFACRLLPAAASLAVTAGLALPAFLVLEPAATRERVGLRLGVLAALGLAMISLTVFRLARVCVAGLGLTRRWKRQATLLPRFGPRMRVRQLPGPPWGCPPARRPSACGGSRVVSPGRCVRPCQ